MPRAKLDAAYCLTAQCEPGRRKTDHWCTHISGFVLEVRASGGKTYALRYVDEGGRQRQHKIGRFDTITNDQARKAAKRLRAEVELGGNPQEEKQERKAIGQYSALADMHLADAKLHQKSYTTVAGNMRNHILPRWGKVRLTDIHQRDVAAWLAEKREAGLAPATVEKIRVTFGRSFELGKRWGVPGTDRNPTQGITRKPINNARERFLTPAEAERLKQAVGNSRSPHLKYIVGLCLLTGCRVGELMRAEWRHFDIERQSWLIPTSKTGKPRHVPLAQAAIDLIGTVPRKEGAIYLFPSRHDPKKPVSCITNAWQVARKEAYLSDLRIHDLRHSAASFMINAGVDLFAVGKVLGHASYQSTQRYSHLANDTLLAAVEAGAKKLKVDWTDTT